MQIAQRLATVGPCLGCRLGIDQRLYFSLTASLPSRRIGLHTQSRVRETPVTSVSFFRPAGSFMLLSTQLDVHTCLSWALSLLLFSNNTRSCFMEASNLDRFMSSLAQARSSLLDPNAFDFKKACRQCRFSCWHTVSWRCIASLDRIPVSRSSSTNLA